MRSSIRHTGQVVALLVGVALTATFITPATAATPTITTSAAASTTRPLTNLAHLDFLTDRVAVTDTAAHSTYKLATDPKVGVLWVYANAKSDGTFTGSAAATTTP
jgi:hypothetical protein